MNSPVSGVGVVMCDTEYIFRAGIVCTCTKQILYLINAVEVSGLQTKIQQYSKTGQLWKNLQKCDHNGLNNCLDKLPPVLKTRQL